MTLIKRKANGDFFPSLSNDLMEMFDIDRFITDPMQFPMWNKATFNRMPGTNIRETKDEYIVEVAAPGLKKKDFHVDIDNGLLEIKVEKEDEFEEKKLEFRRREYNYNAFYRAFTLPETVNAEKIKAEYLDGILKVHLPLVPQAKKKATKEIAVA